MVTTTGFQNIKWDWIKRWLWYSIIDSLLIASRVKKGIAPWLKLSSIILVILDMILHSYFVYFKIEKIMDFPLVLKMKNWKAKAKERKIQT